MNTGTKIGKRTAIVVLCIISITGCGHDNGRHSTPKVRVWRAYVSEGDKIGMGYILVENAGQVIDGFVCVLPPEGLEDHLGGMVLQIKTFRFSGHHLSGIAEISPGENWHGITEWKIKLLMEDEFVGKSFSAKLLWNDQDSRTISFVLQEHVNRVKTRREVLKLFDEFFDDM